MSKKLTNWSGHHTYSTDQIHHPATCQAVQELVHSSQKIGVIGARHSFNDIADSTGCIISLVHLNQVVELDKEQQRVTVEGGLRYDALSQYLNSEGYALRNLASLPDVSVVGACATGTHGSGIRNQGLAAAVRGFEIVTANGDLRTFSCDKDPEELQSVIVNLGGLGVITQITLDIVPAYEMQQFVYENLPIETLLLDFAEVMVSAYSVSLFLNFQSAFINQFWIKERFADGPTSLNPALLGATPATIDRHPIEGLPGDPCTAQQGIPLPWHECLPHFRIGSMPARGNELQSEYMVHLSDMAAAFSAIYDLRDQIAPLLVGSEIRTVASDQLWMSPFYEQNSAAFHFTWHRDWAKVKPVLSAIEAALAPFNARPHWGKMFTTWPTELARLYPKFDAFKELLRDIDPAGKFRNAYLESIFND